MSINPLGMLELGLFSVLIGATDGVALVLGFPRFTIPIAAASAGFDLRLTVAGLGAGGTCDSLT